VHILRQFKRTFSGSLVAGVKSHGAPNCVGAVSAETDTPAPSENRLTPESCQQIPTLGALFPEAGPSRTRSSQFDSSRISNGPRPCVVGAD